MQNGVVREQHPIKQGLKLDIFEHECMIYDIPSLSIRGKPQWSTIKKASDRLTDEHHILYFGDNDKIGRQIFETIGDYVHYLGCECTFHWCGVTEEQEQKYDLPKNVRLDGLDDEPLGEIIKEAILKYIDRRTRTIHLQYLLKVFFSTVLKSQINEIKQVKKKKCDYSGLSVTLLHTH